ncbi:MAG: hypothetical protein JO271_05790 [Verrucomicrobia bacterium]|nr:hypothetical protein [Verrucomicrobiota bacterium]
MQRRFQISNRTFANADRFAVALVLLGIVWGIRQRYGLPTAPLLTPDSWGYLHPALAWLGGAGFQQTGGRAWFYPAILALTIKAGADFSWIVRLQQFLALAAVPLLWLSVRVWLSLYPTRSRLCHSVAVYFAAFASWIYLSNTTQIRFELTIQPEGVLAFFVLAYLVCALAYFRARWFSLHTRSAVLFGSGSFVLSYSILLLKPSWGFAILPSFILVAAGVFGSGSRALRFAPVALAGLVTAGLLAAPNLLGFKTDLGSRTFLPFTLVSIHAAQIVENAAKHQSENRGHALDESELKFYQELAQALNDARKAPLKCKTLGFAPDDIMYTKDFFGKFQAEQHLTDTELIHLCYAAYLRTWLQAPSLMLAKIGKEIGVFLSAPSTDFSAHSFKKQRALETAARFSLSPENLLAQARSREYLWNQSGYLAYLENLERVYREGWQVNCVNWLRYVAVVIAKLSSLIQLIFLASLAVVFSLTKFSPLRLPALGATVVIAAVYGNMLTVAVVHSLDLDRYRTSYTPALLVALVVLTAFLIAVLERARTSGNASVLDQPR